MGTAGILRALLIHIQGEANPLYSIERRLISQRQSGWIARDSLRRFAVLPLIGVGLLLLLALAMKNGQRLWSRFLTGDSPADPLILTILCVMSLAWTVPVATLAGQFLCRERAARTLDLLLVTPYPTSTVLLAKAAAPIQPVWTQALGIASVMALQRIFLIAALLLIAISSPALKALLIISCMIVSIIEPLQELTLAVVIGLASGLIANSSRWALLYGLLGGLLIRLAQIGVVMLAFLQTAQSPLLTSLNAASMGSVVLLVGPPTLIGVGLMIGFVVAREGLIRILFDWTIRRAHEG